MRELGALDDRTLKDFGIHRAEIEAAVYGHRDRRSAATRQPAVARLPGAGAREDEARRMEALLGGAYRRSLRYLHDARERRVSPLPASVERVAKLGGELPDAPSDPERVLAMLDDIGSPATVINAGGRYFGFVNGGALPAALAANWLAAAWDQNAGLSVCSPIAAALENIAIEWIGDALGLPSERRRQPGDRRLDGELLRAGGCAPRAACAPRLGCRERRIVRRAAGHRGGERGGARIAAQGAEPARTRPRARGACSDRSQGRMRADRLPTLSATTVVCIQAGNVNTGAFDPARAICEQAQAANAWVHVDGAFGLWATASSRHRHLTDGIELAQSWALDGHKWLNVPYDCGVTLVREPAISGSRHVDERQLPGAWRRSAPVPADA